MRDSLTEMCEDFCKILYEKKVKLIFVDKKQTIFYSDLCKRSLNLSHFFEVFFIETDISFENESSDEKKVINIFEKEKNKQIHEKLTKIQDFF